MTPIALFFIKANLSLMVFYLLYKLLFAKDTFWKMKRFYWWAVAFFSLYLPMINVENPFSNPQNRATIDLTGISVQVLSAENMKVEQNLATTSLLANIDYQKWLLIAYFIVVGFLLFKTIMQFLSILWVKKRSQRVENRGKLKIFYTNLDVSPFSFFQSIFINTKNFKNPKEVEQILMHEKHHCQQWHSLDMLLAQMLTIAFWFNPFAWLIKREIIINNEFLADQNVVSQYADSKAYQYLLLQEASSGFNIKITNNFYVSPIKKRIIMLNTIKSKSISLLKYFAIFPLAVGIIFVANTGELKAQKTEDEQVKNTFTTNKNHYNLSKIKKGVLVILDGKPYNKPIDQTLTEKIDYVEYLTPEEGRRAYRQKGAKGVVVIVTKDDNRNRPKLKKGYRKVKTVIVKESGNFDELDQENNIIVAKRGNKAETHMVNKEALILVDGIPLPNCGRELEDLDIASVSVLKGEDAKKLYARTGNEDVFFGATRPNLKNDIDINKKKLSKDALIIIDGVSYGTRKPNILVNTSITYHTGAMNYDKKVSKGVVLITTKQGNNKSNKKVKAIEFNTPNKNKKSNQDRKSIEFNAPDKPYSSSLKMKNHQLDKDALILVDGKEYKKPMETIEPNTIESISVLKDKAATDVYGEKGKKGVILITSKKNKKKDVVRSNSDKIDLTVIDGKRKEPVYNDVDVAPEFIGGQRAMYHFISRNLVYPKEAIEKGIEGEVTSVFIIDKTGKVSNVRVVEGVYPALDKEAVRVIKMMPKWKPAQIKGKNVAVNYTLPIVFYFK